MQPLLYDLMVNASSGNEIINITAMYKNSYFQKYPRNDKTPYFARRATKNIIAYISIP